MRLGASACHVGGGYTVGGTVTGMRGSGLVLQDNGGDSLTFSSNGTFTFTSGIDQGGAYSVTVKTQPSGQTCSVHNGSGTIGTADISNVIVNCTGPGRYAYVANQTANTISAYAIDAASGALTPIAGSPFAATGTTPVAVTVDPNGVYLYVANNGSNDVSVYSIDDATGALTAVGRACRLGQRTIRPSGRPVRSVPIRHQQERQHRRGVRDRQRRLALRHRRLAVLGGQ